ncbi:MAG TPA: RNA polymerase sigma factor [Rhizomicrobium sp.]|jgi:RNA polymerase sigma-70 factor (ECF subfamily)|nr:RNA polymerase sigma factor [Rhizomicrobium sp.]
MPKYNEMADDQVLLTDLDRRFRAPLMAYFLRRTQDRQDAEDLTQDTFARLVGASGRLEAHTHAPALVFRVAANLLKDRKRRQAVHKQTPFSALDEDMIDAISSRIAEGIEPERVLIGQENLAEACKVLEGLEDRTRTIFVLYRLEGMKHRDIAARLGIGLSTVEKHCMLAIAALAARFSGRCP